MPLFYKLFFSCVDIFAPVRKQHNLLQQLTSLHEIPYVVHRLDAEIENQIQINLDS